MFSSPNYWQNIGFFWLFSAFSSTLHWSVKITSFPLDSSCSSSRYLLFFRWPILMTYFKFNFHQIFHSYHSDFSGQLYSGFWLCWSLILHLFWLPFIAINSREFLNYGKKLLVLLMHLAMTLAFMIIKKNNLGTFSLIMLNNFKFQSTFWKINQNYCTDRCHNASIEIFPWPVD